MEMQDYDAMSITNTRVPVGSPIGRMQEATVTQDPDGDGITTFDEVNRFGTNAGDHDTDRDCVPDKLDMHSYLYSPHNVYNPAWSDWDGDGLRKERDRDNDGGER